MRKDYDAFVEEVIAEVKKRLGSGYEVAAKEALKNNGVVRRGIVISDGVEKAAPLIYMDHYYELHSRGNGGEEDIKVAADEAVAEYRRERGWQGRLPIRGAMDQRKALDSVLFRVVSTERNARLLGTVPHYSVSWLGLSMVFYIPVHSVREDEMATVTVSNSLMEIWGVTERELLEHARRNTPSALAPSIENISELLKGLIEDEGPDPQPEMYVATNRRRLYGAVCMFYDGLLERMAERAGMGLYVLPSSIHEVILVPAKFQDEGRARELRRMVMEINRSGIVSEQDILSDEVYFYDQKECALSIAN